MKPMIGDQDVEDAVTVEVRNGRIGGDLAINRHGPEKSSRDLIKNKDPAVSCCEHNFIPFVVIHVDHNR